ncbi:MAG: hypothetical protein K2N51_11375 [Lachnospiraceae bacterium]|nr:hypothetical protein [Lachnospiraceae bacterium]
MGTEIKNAVEATDIDACYDEKAKRLLSNKIILAHILVKTVDEFQGMNQKDVQSYIEGEPFVSKVPVEPGLTNIAKEKDGQRIVGMNTENAEINEGLVRFDIIFYVRVKDGISQVIVNLEAQKNEPTGYHILNRAVFYASHLISSQKERDFVKMKYNDIRRVFSIWVCMGIDENCMDYVHLANDKLLGSYHWKGRMDLLNIIMIGISDEVPKHDNKYELHRLLSTLLSVELSVNDKLGIIETEYDIPVEDRIREDVSEMCNLSQGIREKGRAEGEAIGKAEIIINMYNNGFSMEQIVLATNKSIEEIKTIIEEDKLDF